MGYDENYRREMEWGQVVAYNGDGTCQFLVDGREEPYDRVPIHNLSLQGGRCAIVFYNKQRNLPHVFSNSPKTRKPGTTPTTIKTFRWIQFHQDSEFGRKVPYEISGITPDNLKQKWTMTLERPA